MKKYLDAEHLELNGWDLRRYIEDDGKICEEIRKPTSFSGVSLENEAEWIGTNRYRCSKCGNEALNIAHRNVKSPYCPWCGCKMKGK